MIVVSGASGQLGRATLQHLRERTDAARVRALSRTPDRIADLGVATRPADFDDPDGLLRAFDGAERLLLISTNELTQDGRRTTQHTNAVRAAARAGVGHVLYTSVVHATNPDNPALIARDHAATESALAESGLPHTLLRENMYTDLLLGSAPQAVADGVLADSIGSGATAYVTRDDVAAVAAALLADGGYENQALDVTGPVAVTPAELAATLTGITGVPVTYRPMTDEELVATLVGLGLPEPVAQLYASAYQAIRQGWLNGVSDVVARVTGRPATSVADFLSANRALLVGAGR